ncbi:unnamed protein product [Caenorhabditis auriculariae]|uniref:Uncharacterized protein n=1 Tax=Caenorhabditis auriculariae TaxID=2777116 RepID=A0A8S1HGP2_9PELO|nr:unnamed protein product [Caenorhabditis auriculariae]
MMSFAAEDAYQLVIIVEMFLNKLFALTTTASERKSRRAPLSHLNNYRQTLSAVSISPAASPSQTSPAAEKEAPNLCSTSKISPAHYYTRRLNALQQMRPP